MELTVKSVDEMQALGKRLGRACRGGELFELVGDVGAGKTTFTKGLAQGLGVAEDVQSPTFTISRMYEARDGLTLAHYDFYRLTDAGILRMELAETAQDAHTVTVIEWGGIVEDVLPAGRMTLAMSSPSETARVVTIIGMSEALQKEIAP